MSEETRAPRRNRAAPAKAPRPKRAAGAARAAAGTGGGELERLAGTLAAVRDIGAAFSDSMGLDALFARTVPAVSRLMRAERTTLFLYDEDSREIWSKLAEGETRSEIRLALGRGIAGWVARERKPVIVADAYRDSRFAHEVDARTGFRTHAVAAAPIIGKGGALLGVLQVLNHAEGAFGEDDLGLLEAIATHMAYAVENARLSQRLIDQNQELEAAQRRAERRRAELDLLYQLEQETSAAANLDELLDSAIVRTCERLRSDAGSVLLVDSTSGKLFFRAVSGPKPDELRRVVLELGQGVVGWVAQHGQPAVVNDPALDDRHARGLADQLGYPARAVLAVPLVAGQRVIGAVEVLNPTRRPTGAIGYDEEDLKLLTVVAGQLARAVSVALERQARLDTERLALVGRMLAGVAHDLRSPMTVIGGYAQLMVTSSEEADRKDSSERILREVDEMTGMIADLLAFARGDSRLRPTGVGLTALGREIADNLRMQCAARGIELEVDAAEGTAVVDLGRVKRVVYNLARNAIDAVARGGHVRIGLALEDAALAIRVRDDGPGLPEELSRRLFEPFATSGKTHGTGLGLSIVKRFVDDHGGTIAVESGAGQGTTFAVRLPPAGPDRSGPEAP